MRGLHLIVLRIFLRIEELRRRVMRNMITEEEGMKDWEKQEERVIKTMRDIQTETEKRMGYQYTKEEEDENHLHWETDI